MAENSPDQTSLTPATAENRESETSFNTGDSKTAEFWEKHWLRASTRIGVDSAMGEARAQQDGDEQGASYPQALPFFKPSTKGLR